MTSTGRTGRQGPGVLGRLGLATAGQLSIAAAHAQEKPATRLIESPLSSSNLVDTALGLLAVLAVMLLLAWLVKRFVQVPGNGKGRVQILGGVSLGAREKAVLLSVEGRRLLVGVAPGRVQTLLELGAAPEDFALHLDQAVGADNQHASGEPA